MRTEKSVGWLIASAAFGFAFYAASADFRNDEGNAATSGDPQAGRQLFEKRLSCLECHAVHDKGGDVGPDLSNIGDLLTPAQIKAKLKNPGKVTTKGYLTLQITLENGKQVAGLVESETEKQLLLRSGKKIVTIKRGDIADRVELPSDMPSNVIEGISDRQLDDLVAYLKRLKKTGSFVGTTKSAAAR